VHHDHRYKFKGKEKVAKSRFLTCKVFFKQNIGHLGKDFVVCGVHGHYKTMKIEWPEAWVKFWDRLADKIVKYGIQFMAGDFNMSLTEVPKQLRSRGIKVDCVSWYPWLHTTKQLHDQPLGFDSCAIFYIGGNLEVRMPYDFREIPRLCAVAAEVHRKTGDDPLDEYEGQNHPGQHWSCYRSKGLKETEDEKDLMKRLRDLLIPSTSYQELQAIPRTNFYCPYLRVTQKRMDKNEWRVGDRIHNGAHFPLCVFTKNASARSRDAAKRRGEKPRRRSKSKERFEFGKDKGNETYYSGQGSGRGFWRI